jgi:hypothetical protein
MAPILSYPGPARHACLDPPSTQRLNVAPFHSKLIIAERRGGLGSLAATQHQCLEPFCFAATKAALYVLLDRA